MRAPARDGSGAARRERRLGGPSRRVRRGLRGVACAWLLRAIAVLLPSSAAAAASLHGGAGGTVAGGSSAPSGARQAARRAEAAAAAAPSVEEAAAQAAVEREDLWEEAPDPRKVA